MADKPITFSAAMVRALLAGTKTQTRRLLNPQPEMFPVDEAGTLCDVYCIHVEGEAVPRIAMGSNGCGVITLQKVPYAVGDRLYVRDAWRVSSAQDHLAGSKLPWPLTVEYLADGQGYFDGRYRHARYMPRWASRLWLEVTEVRVERLQSISEADSIAEGIEAVDYNGEVRWRCYQDPDPLPALQWMDPRFSYRSLWRTLHTDPGKRWEDNPWIVAVSFAVHHGNVDQAKP